MMSNNSDEPIPSGTMDDLAPPLHLQQLHNALRLDTYLQYIDDFLNDVENDSEVDSYDEDLDTSGKQPLGSSKAYNFSGIQKKRRWLVEALCNTSDSEDEHFYAPQRPPAKRRKLNTKNSIAKLQTKLQLGTKNENDVVSNFENESDLEDKSINTKSSSTNFSQNIISSTPSKLPERINAQSRNIENDAKSLVSDDDNDNSHNSEAGDDDSEATEESDESDKSNEPDSESELYSDGSYEESLTPSERINAMMREHMLRKTHAKNFQMMKNSVSESGSENPWLARSYLFYGASLLCNSDRFADHQRYLAAAKKTKLVRPSKGGSNLTIGDDSSSSTSKLFGKLSGKQPCDVIAIKEEEADDSSLFDQNDSFFADDLDDNNDFSKIRTKTHSKKDKKGKKLDAQALAVRRHKLWLLMSRKEVIKSQRTRANVHKEQLHTLKRVAIAASKAVKQKAIQSQRIAKDKVWLLKRLSRSMQVEWKKYDRIVKEQNKRLEKEAEEQRKMDKEIIEVKRQQRKVNFLITLPELYAHFMQKKIGGADEEETGRILKQLEDDGDDPDDSLQAQALLTAQEAVRSHQSGIGKFSGNSSNVSSDSTQKLGSREYPQPSIFMGQLKSYQMKGMNWLANLYYFGINGILADEMGLGKTVQAVAFLAHICEEYDTWGPFLIVTPASTLHNWTAEINRFVPEFKIVPYWGTPEERKSLRKFFDTKHSGERHNTSFHVVVTSYHIVIQDLKFLNRIKWNYMVLDEAQAIKSINSQRWKLLLGFSCRNRLLLSGTPIQNTMAELWALLHFIMPALFDSHQWFNEWFSKDIEGHVENRTIVDEKHLNRLHTILKPFMLRRIKTEVENELSDKVEIMVYCPLTLRQKFLYSGLKNKISIDELLNSTGASCPSNTQSAVTNSLMNLVMQFRKVCNHPELLERREVQSPFLFKAQGYLVPRMVYLMSLLSETRHLTRGELNPFSVENIYRNLVSKGIGRNRTHTWDTNFSFARLCGLSLQEVSHILEDRPNVLWKTLLRHFNHNSPVNRHRNMWHSNKTLDNRLSLILPAVDYTSLKGLIFCSHTSTVYTHTSYTLHYTPETPAHRAMRSRKSPLIEEIKSEEVKSSILSKISPVTRECEAVDLPLFLTHTCPKVHCTPRLLYSYSHKTRAWSNTVTDRQCEITAMLHCGAAKVIAESISPSQERTLPSICDITDSPRGGLEAYPPKTVDWTGIIIPDKHSMIMDAGKLYVLDTLLNRMKAAGNRVLIYSQMTKMINLLEEYMRHRKHTYMRLDGSSKISDRRDMVADFQSKSDIFVFLLSTRAGGVGINLTAADTVIFYDSDWNPTVDQQAMDRAHRVGQTKQVTVYRLICKGTIEERMLQRAKEKSEIQRMVISGGNFKPDTLKPKEVVSLLLDDDIEKQFRARQSEKKALDEQRTEYNKEKMRERMRKRYAEKKFEKEQSELKRRRLEDGGSDSQQPPMEDIPSPMSVGGGLVIGDLDGDEESVMVMKEESDDLVIADISSPSSVSSSSVVANPESPVVVPVPTPPIRGQRKRGRPRMSTIRGRGAASRTTEGLTQSSPIPPVVGVKRGRGRPRLVPLGPGHMGQRPAQNLPAALGSLQQRGQEEF